jgi:exonuclease III
MKILSFNYMGVARSQKKLSLKRLIMMLNKPIVILLQETLVEESLMTRMMDTLLPFWKFFGSNALGWSGGLVIGWSTRLIKVTNSWALESYLGVDLQIEGMGLEFRVLNVYGLYYDQATFWNSLLNKHLLRSTNPIIGGT